MTHIRTIDGLRAWMAWWVVCQHLLQISGVAQSSQDIVMRFLTMGGLAVMVFAIISGFVITNLLIVKQEHYVAYITRRFLRIYPLYVVALLLALLLRGPYYDFVAQSPWASPGTAARFASEQAAMPIHIALHALLLQGVVPNSVLAFAPMAILGPAWSLSLEWQYYLIAPAITTTFLRRGLAAQAITCIGWSLAMTGTYAAGAILQWEYPAFLPLVIGFFLLGSVTRLYFEPIDRRRLILPAIVAAANLLLYAHAYCGGHIEIALLPIGFWSVAIVVGLYKGGSGMIAKLMRVVGALLGSRRMAKLGLWSYSTYLLHIPMFVAVLWIAHAVGAPATVPVRFATLVAACFPLLGLSCLSYVFVEKKAMQWGLSKLPGDFGQLSRYRKGDATPVAPQPSAIFGETTGR
jgi:peptidoglycan/LPS O-acetylase OafA/YrhL